MRKGLIPREEILFRIVTRVNIPENVKISIKGKVIGVEGPLGTLKRGFEGNLHIYFDGDEVILRTDSLKRHDRAMIGAVGSRIQNMILGVTEGFTYRLFVYFKHFPITAQVEGNKVCINNFLGEKSPRYAKIVGDVKVEVNNDQLIVKGIDKEAVSQTAANVHQAARVKNLSLHGRGGGVGFLDGIYVFERAAGEGKGNLPVDKRQFARQYYFEMKICRDCGSRNARSAIKCRRCRSRNLRKRKAAKGV